uniref:Uncharacterized protein n=1 Tax=Nelumbo nucifera TaxID=4432 RepID=A0A822YAQ7_NELNU|nr:TPA_asm: hypothetical protein HUJ06_030661 [Nelumbo nucifera]
MFQAKKLMPLKSWKHMEISLEPFNFVFLTDSLMKLLSSKIQFAPIVLVDMLNTSGAIQSLE